MRDRVVEQREREIGFIRDSCEADAGDACASGETRLERFEPFFAGNRAQQ